MEGDQTKRKIAIFTLSTVTGVAISSIVKTIIPRKIGPDQFGIFYNFENLTIFCFSIVTLGLDQFTRSKRELVPKEIDQIHREAFFIRAVLFITIAALLIYSFPKFRTTILLFIIWQIFFTQNTIFCSLLQRDEKILANSTASVLSKILFLFVFLSLHNTIRSALDCALIISMMEIVRTAIISATLIIKKINLSIRPIAPSFSTVKILLPFFSLHASQQLYARTNGVLIPAISNPTELGYYGAANNIILLGVIFAPSLNAVFTPTLSKIKNRKERNKITDSSTVIILPLLIFIASLTFSLSAEVSTKIFGEGFIYSSLSLKFLSPTIPITYISIVCGIEAINTNKTIALTKINLKSLLFTAVTCSSLLVFFSPNRPGLPSALASISILICESFAAYKISKLTMLSLGIGVKKFTFISGSLSTFIIGIISIL